MPLSDAKCRNAKPSPRASKIFDGGGLYLYLTPAGGKLWRLAFRYDGKQKSLSLGSYPTVGLKEARQAREEAKQLLAEGIDPAKIKQTQKAAQRRGTQHDFELVARQWFEDRRPGWTAGYSDRLLRRLEADIFPSIGRIAIATIEPPELLSAIRQIERRGAVELARRLLQVSGQIFRYGVANGLVTRDPSQDLRGALRSPGPPRHRAALKAKDLPDFLAALDHFHGDRTTALGLWFVLRTFVRSAEARFATWSEFENLESQAPLWRIPGSRMKGRTEHLVPLAPQVVLILRELKKLSGTSEWLFPSPSKAGVISENTWLYAVYRLGYHTRLTVHGFRGTASTILNEAGFNRDWIERQLAHSEGNDVRRAYNAAEYLQDRRKMMNWWNDYLDRHRRKSGLLTNPAPSSKSPIGFPGTRPSRTRSRASP